MHFSKEAIKLTLINGLFLFANGLSSVFVYVYFWKLTRSYLIISVYTIFIYALMPVGFILSGYFSRVKNILFCLRLGMVAFITFFGLVFYLNYDSIKYLYVLGVLFGLGNGYFYFTYNTLTYHFTNESNRALYLGINSAIANFANIIAPIIAGVIIISRATSIGYGYVFLTSCLIYVLILLISYDVKKIVIKNPFSINRYISLLKDKDWRFMVIATMVLGLREGCIYFLIDILYLNAFRNELFIGSFVSVNALLGICGSLIVGKFIRECNYSKFIILGGILNLFATIILVSWTSHFSVIFYGIITSIFDCFWLIPTYLIYYKVVHGIIVHNGDEFGNYMIFKEIPIALSRVVGILIFIAIELSPFHLLSVKFILPIISLMILFSYWFGLKRIINNV